MKISEMIEVTHTSEVSGASKLKRSILPYLAFIATSLQKYDRPEAMIIITRITKIHTSSCTCTEGSVTASMMKEIRATPVTP